MWGRTGGAALATGTLLLAGPALAQGVAHHHVSAALDVPGHRITATDTVRLTEAPAGAWTFLLHTALDVTAVTIAGQPADFAVTDGWDPRSYWERPPYAELDGFEIAREWEVKLPAAGWSDGAGIAITYGGVIADSLHSPERAYGRSFETTSGRIVDQGAYLSGATLWVPWHGDSPFTFDLTVDTPQAWTTVSQGKRVETPPASPGRSVIRWVGEHPTEEIHLIAGPYTVERRDHHGVSLETWTYADTPAEISRPYLDAAAEAIDRFAAQLGPYPFSKFALVENYWQTGYGMPSFTFLGDRVIRLPFIIHTSFPHEILHNWWGNSVYVDGGNWCEGLTTYGADYAAKEQQGGTAARDYRRDALIGYRDFALAGGRDFPLSKFRERDSAATQAVGYGKTLMVFHMLRTLVGEDVFSASLRRFYQDNRFRAANWDDIRVAFERESRRELQGFFDQWVERPGAMGLSLADVRREQDQNGRWVVQGEVVQTAPAFAAPVKFVLSGPNAESEPRVLEVASERTSFRWVTEFPVLRVAADEGFDLFRTLHSAEVAPVLSGVLGADSTRIVIGADVPEDVGVALRSLAGEWARDSTFVVLEEASAGDGFAGATWFFGDGPRSRAFHATLPAVERSGGSLVATGRSGAEPGSGASSALLWVDSPDVVGALGRKIPHYSKYSYLLFDGDRNVGKGVWDPGDSPLVVRFAAVPVHSTLPAQNPDAGWESDRGREGEYE